MFQAICFASVAVVAIPGQVVIFSISQHFLGTDKTRQLGYNPNITN